MKVFLTEEQFEQYKNYLREHLDEKVYHIPGKALNQIRQYTNDVAKDLYGDEYGTYNEYLSSKYAIDVTNDGDIKTGIFSVGNAKLSDDTLIINFTSALGCPSLTLCPVSQKACYAVAGENRLPDTRRKNLKVQNLWKQALKRRAEGKKDAIDQIFNIAGLYINTLAKSKHPIRFIRFNEAGDFPTQSILDAAAAFAKKAREKYNIISTAYTAKSGLNFTKEIDGTPIDKIIKINASVDTIKLSPDTTHQKFNAIPMDYKTALENNDKVEEISDAEANKLKCRGVTNGANGANTVPLLSYGKWSGGEGWYYVCPCSFWKYNKDKAASKYYISLGLTDVDTTNDAKAQKNLKALLTPEQDRKLKSILNKITSPCGTQCAVCHDMEGGLTPDGKVVKDYVVLTATHGPTHTNFNPDYANAKKKGDNTARYSKDNPYGIDAKFNLPYKKKMDAKQEKQTDNNQEQA